MHVRHFPDFEHYVVAVLDMMIDYYGIFFTCQLSEDGKKGVNVMVIYNTCDSVEDISLGFG